MKKTKKKKTKSNTLNTQDTTTVRKAILTFQVERFLTTHEIRPKYCWTYVIRIYFDVIFLLFFYIFIAIINCYVVDRVVRKQFFTIRKRRRFVCCMYKMFRNEYIWMENMKESRVRQPNQTKPNQRPKRNATKTAWLMHRIKQQTANREKFNESTICICVYCLRTLFIFLPD